MNGKEEKIDRHDAIISAPLNIFASKPFNGTFIERRIDEIFATPKDPFSEVYTFTRPGNNVGLLKSSDALISCDLSIRSQVNALVDANTVVVPPLPLRTLFKTKETKINEVLVTPSSNESHIQSYIAFLTREVPSGYKDSKSINLSHLDMAAHMDAHNQAGSGAISRRDLTRVNAHVIDMVDCTCFNDGEDVWLPSALKIELN